jgi:hypothetical protein
VEEGAIVSKIWTPPPTRDQVVAQERERQRQLDQLRKERVKQLVKDLREKGADEISDPEGRDKVRSVCRMLFSKSGRCILPGPDLKLDDVARLISDVLLGDGAEYEVPT